MSIGLRMASARKHLGKLCPGIAEGHLPRRTEWKSGFPSEALVPAFRESGPSFRTHCRGGPVKRERRCPFTERRERSTATSRCCRICRSCRPFRPTCIEGGQAKWSDVKTYNIDLQRAESRLPIDAFGLFVSFQTEEGRTWMPVRRSDRTSVGLSRIPGDSICKRDQPMNISSSI
jgi:hypothetical protein